MSGLCLIREELQAQERVDENKYEPDHLHGGSRTGREKISKLGWKNGRKGGQGRKIAVRLEQIA
jgi:hypothetical protein